MYETEENMTECKFTSKVQVQPEQQASTVHSFPETADHNITQSLNERLVPDIC
jgi:hypothetical protein